MDSTARQSLHDFTLKARLLLTDEARQLLEGVYGLSPKGYFEPADSLPAVQGLPEARETRERLEELIADEVEVGLSRAEATEKLVREVAYTHLNRLVAFKMMEARNLVRGTLDKLHASNAFLRYLPDNPEDYDLYDQGDHPQDALGEGPRDIAYRRFILNECARISKEVRVLFDPDDIASRLFPRPVALKTIVGMLNDPDVAEAWSPQSDETLGWVYQYFNEREKAEVFDRLYKKKQKIRAEDVPAATQLFTPRWIVRQLVHNSLGRLWTEMHPDSRLKDSLDYLVPLAADAPKPEPQMKPAKEIIVLDPACGTMHFGLVAMDVLADMYREELENAGKDGWPDEPSVTNEEDIPAAILENNLFGMDLDNRAVQLSALTLYLKAKSLNPKADITAVNLACADINLPTGAAADERLEALIRDAGFDRPVHERILRAAVKRLGQTAVAGSLVRVEEDVVDLIDAERRRFEREGQEQDIYGDFAGFSAADTGDEEFWDALKVGVFSALDRVAGDGAVPYFVGEAREGLRVLDVMLRRYDVALANPPYLSRRNMNKDLAAFLDKAYPQSKGDLYTAFIERCSGMLKEGGRVGMISQQSFMFISSYEKLRTALARDHAIETVCHVGARAFAEIGGEKVNTVMFVLRRAPEDEDPDTATGTYFRLTREPDAKAKRLGYERSIRKLREDGGAAAVFRYGQGDLKAIPGAPWVYWITPGLRRLFDELENLKDSSPPRVGLQTGDNFRFLRFWWEVGDSRTARGYTNAWSAKQSGERWFPYMKGGEFRRWYGNQELAVNWSDDGEEIKNFGIETGKVFSRPQNTPFYFQRGVTWSFVGSDTFSARLSPGGFVFDVGGSSLFPKDVLKILSIVNSTFASYALRLVNPTVNFQVGDLSRLPIPSTSSDTLEGLVEEAISLAKSDSEEDETTYDFVSPPNWVSRGRDVLRRRERLAAVEAEIDEEVYRLYGISGEDRAAIEAELAEPTAAQEEASGEVGEESESEVEDSRELAAGWISYSVGLILGRFVPGEEDSIGRGDFPPEVVEKLRELVDPDGVATLERDHPDDLAAKVEAALDTMLGDDEAQKLLAAAGISQDVSSREGLRRYLERDYFKRHVKQYRKRPVYWLLQSPGKKYGVYVFHEKITPDTLFLLRGGRYLGGSIGRVREAITDLGNRAAATDEEGREKKRLARELAGYEAVLLDLEAMDRELAAVTSVQDDRGKTVGWEPEIDDGVIINLAPLYTLMPSWSAEPKKHLAALEAGSYDWSHTAMRYWPERVTRECENNKSFAIAHGLTDEYVGGN